MYGSWITIKGNQASAQDAIDLLNQPLPAESLNIATDPILFEKALTLINLSFRYHDQGPWILKDLNLEISKGSRVGFMGVTGSGKTTLLDIVMGLLPPTEGQLMVDETPLNDYNIRSWQAHISHVPQTIYLADTTIAENIAFGVPFEQIDRKRMKEAAQMAQISHTIEGWTKGYETVVGERGIRLSGGQRQRIGIARALYKRSSVIILDEATSALDIETEAAVIKAIEKLADDITIMIITHRLTTLNNCDRILEVKDGYLKEINVLQIEQTIV
jgi:ATP-binding cassette subfamily B protein